ncbi:ribonuclease HII [Clostridium botulinum]|uniref:Ribonuclease HII n=1 Tax=Clostridium botulinum C/D str. DC5 TaxID=1443128 RepID=A0A0A0IDU0_CLOBO|nr:ribonuclease HII [Clostridium botulinum]KEI01429.1 ribonuclease HII [Clostridium botulinum C/D str. BKT75002]KEI07763.1 ribonuclease HII [Clostridium botulinum C/D str. BKT2873]KGM94177.1 ribonuclease HII [Clostridium botulinum D str. CCUG 7971]KGM99122.1 ribonuclease HII [Clostridium botulinum C/D str. DC5]KOC49631.1 ribonuclease HII [Clostridium botulinum]
MNIIDMKVSEIKTYVSNLLNNYDKNTDYKSIIKVLQSDNRVSVKKLSTTIEKFLQDRENEIQRVKTMYQFDLEYIVTNGYLAGCDEVGRGPLAGPIVAAAVILDLEFVNNDKLILKINDSKKIKPELREELAKIIKEKAIAYCVAEIDNSEIDNKGIAWCNNEVLQRSVNGLKVKPDLVLSDGYKIKNCSIDNKFVVKGDAKSASIACASIIAKVYRDKLMQKYSEIYKNYAFDKNMGYGTKEHIDSIKKYGCTPIHRKSFLTNILNTF